MRSRFVALVFATLGGMASPAAADPPVAAEGALGSSAAHPDPSGPARRQNIAALRHHRAGRFAQARDGFRRALAEAPDYPIARYNLACALSRLGEVDAAARELEALLASDLPRFGPRLDEDPDLLNLRASAAGATLRARVQALRTAWAGALAAGVPVTITGRTGGTAWAQAGVWVSRTRRFVPMAPPVTVTPWDPMGIPLTAAQVDPALGRVVAVTGQGRNADVPAIDRMRLLVFRAGEGRPESEVTLPIDELTRSEVEIHATAEGARFRIVLLDETYLFGTWRALGPAGVVATPDRGEPARPALHVVQEGWFRKAAEVPGFRLRGRTLETPRGRIELPAGHGGGRLHEIVLSPDGTLAVVVSIGGDTGGCAEGTPTRHVVDLVDLGAGRAERLDAGPGWATALFGADGALYLQRGDTVVRHASARDRHGEALPEGMLLSPQPPICR